MPPNDDSALSGAEQHAIERIIDEPIATADAVWGRSHVQRIVTPSGRSFVAKRPRQAGERLAPEEARRRFDAELANLRYLQGGPAGVVPSLIGSDPDRRVLVMEDLPSGRSLATTLLGSSSEQAVADLEAYAAALGAIHRWSIKHPQETQQVWGFAAPALAGVDRFIEFADRWGIHVPHAFADACREAVELLSEGGAWRGFVHGDGCPDNMLLTDDRFVLFDFESSFVGSVLIDVSYFLAPFPSCWCWASLPTTVGDRLVERYVEELGDRPGLRRGIAAALAVWAISRGHMLPALLDGDRDWGTTGVRARLVQWCDSFCRFDASAAEWTPIRDVLEPLADTLRTRWAVEPLAYPAFAAGGATPVPVPDWFNGL